MYRPVRLVTVICTVNLRYLCLLLGCGLPPNRFKIDINMIFSFGWDFKCGGPIGDLTARLRIQTEPSLQVFPIPALLPEPLTWRITSITLLIVFLGAYNRYGLGEVLVFRWVLTRF